jgi:xanthine dehydrogenase accessory factor
VRDVAADVRRWLDAGDRVALATVVETWGSSPRPLGSKMAVSSAGEMAGSVSNGCIEGAVFEEALEVLRTGQARLVPYGISDDVAFEVGLACGGHVEVYIQPLQPAHSEVLGRLAADRPAATRTHLETGDTELVEEIADTELPYRDGPWFVEPYPRPPQLVIVGGIHIAIPLHRLARVAGYKVVVVDARSKFATPERFSEADELVVAWPDEALADMAIDRSTSIVILTHDPKFDLPALRTALRSRAGYIGAIGSRKTNQNRFDALRKEGFTDRDLERVRGPIGLDLGSRGAEEVALGILAEVTAFRFGGSGRPMSEAKTGPAAATI